MRPKLDKDALQWTLELVKEIESCWKRTGIIIDDNNVNQAISIGNKGDAYTNHLCGLNSYETETNSIIKSIQTYAKGIMYVRLFPEYA
ncbi:23890_t:CDS:2, partial [Gigaspora margarita]